MLSRVPRWYSPWGHLAFPALAGLALVAFALSRIQDLRAWQLAFVPVFLVVGNALEWHAHRGLLHRRVRFLEVLYVRHTPQHHGVFTSEDMAIRSARELKLVLLPAFGVLAIILVSLPVAFVLASLGQANLAALWVASAVAYVLSYEWLHLAYHLPDSHPVGRLRAIRWLRRHHQLHHAPHLMQRWNFNVTLPLWDHLRGTVHRGAGARAPVGAKPAAR
jgi:sterol desaturase/sphingolipid hydroxylase (fatty acid hydroxylase superfamily)